jgi:hypothetical protein
MKRIRTIAKYLLAAFIGVTIVVVILSFTTFFNSRLRALLISSLSSQVNGTVEIGDIHGNILTGVIIDSVRISGINQPVFSTGKIQVKYRLIALLNHRIHLKTLSIEHPVFHMVRFTDSTWNYQRLLHQGNGKSGAFPWTVYLDDFKMNNGEIAVDDSLELLNHKPMIGIQDRPQERFSFKDVNLHIGGIYRTDNLTLKIISAHLTEPFPEPRSFTFRGNIVANEQGASIDNFAFKSPGSDFTLAAALRNINVFAGAGSEQLHRSVLAARLDMKSFSFDEVKRFVPQLDFLGGSVGVELDARGPFSDLHFTRLSVRTASSVVNFTGSIKNLEKPDRLYLDLYAGESKIEPTDLAKLLPRSNIPSFERAGVLALTGSITGSLNNFNSSLALKGKNANVAINGNLNTERELPAYDVKFSTKDLHIERFIDNVPPIVISSNGNVKGEGFDPKNMTAALTLDIDSASYRSVRMTGSKIKVAATPDHFDGTASLHSGWMNAQVSASADRVTTTYPHLEADVLLQSVNIDKVLADTSLHTTISGEAKISSDGSTIDDLSGKASVSLAPSTIKGFDVPARDIEVTLDQRDFNNSSLSITSPIADAQLHGKFDLDIVGAYLAEQLPNLLHQILDHTSAGDAGMFVNENALRVIRKHSKERQSVDFTYEVEPKDLGPLGDIILNHHLEARGRITGSFRGSAEMLSVTGTGSVDTFYYANPGTEISLRDAAITLHADSMTLAKTLESISGTIELNVPEATVHTTPIRDLAWRVRFGNSRSTFTLDGAIDSSYEFSSRGTTAVEPYAYSIDLDTMSLKTKKYVLHNDNDIQARIDTGGFRIMHALIRHQNDYLSMSGAIGHDGMLDLDASLRTFPLNEFGIFFNDPNAANTDPGFRGTASTDIHLSGTTSAPVFSVVMNVDSAYYRQSKIGNVIIKGNYQDQLAHFNIVSRSSSTDTIPTLSINGTLPINLAFSGVDERFPDVEESIQLHTDGVELGIIQPFFPELQGLHGTATGDIGLAGTPRNPLFEGKLRIDSGSFVFSPNNIPYVIQGDLKPDGNNILFKNFSVKNTPGEKIGGEAKIDGSLTIKNFQLDSFDLTVHGQLLGMNDATRRILPTLYGTLFTEMGEDSLRFSGTPDRPFLSGTIYTTADLTFPTTQTTAATGSSSSLPYLVIDDTSKSMNISSTSDSSKGYDISKNTKVQMLPQDSGGTFTDKLRYNLTIETRGKTSVRMIFTPATGEELYAELDGRVKAINTDGTPMVYGDVNVGSDSYYNFYKRFAATGTLKFVGPWDNPELNIAATYEAYKQPTSIDTTGSKLPEKVIVEVDITGTRLQPKPTFDIKTQTDPSQAPTEYKSATEGGDVQADALSFIIWGKFQDEVTSADAASISSSAGSLVASNLLSGILTNLLQDQFSFIQSATLSYQNGNPDLRFSGAVAKGYFTVGGQVLNDIGNTNVRYQLNLGEVFDRTSLRNLFFDFERNVDDATMDEPHKNTATNTAKVFYKISF